MNRHETVKAHADTRITTYRPFIDGLRAISVLSVVLYHAGYPTLSGGFVGVDVFFVISGFLIINQITSAIGERKFALADFWARRALRILPPYLLVIVVCIFLAPHLLILPDEFSEFGEEVLYSALMIVNHLFLNQQGYFDGAANTKPLLHLWTLSVEEQFYVFAPLVLIGLSWVRWNTIRASLSAAALLAVSLGACIALTNESKNYAFYLMPLRAWEFIAGGAIALVVPYALRLPRLGLEAIAVFGLCLIAFAVFTFSDSTSFPSFMAAVPVLGASIVILAGISDDRLYVIRFLSLKPMVWIGLLSYSWYLWHWPLLVFARLYNFGEYNASLASTMVVLSLFLAIHTHLWIERPIQKWRRLRPGPMGWTPAGFGILAASHIALAGFMYSTVVSANVAMRLPDEMQPVFPTLNPKCRLAGMQDPGNCLSVAPGKQVGLLIGDSFAQAMYPVLVDQAWRAGSVLTTLTYGACSPMLLLRNFGRPKGEMDLCTKGKQNAIALMKAGKLKPSYAILVARWAFYTPLVPQRWLLGPIESNSPDPDQEKAFIGGLRDTVDLLKSLGVKRIMIVAQVPEFPRLVPPCILRSDMYEIPRDEKCSSTRAWNEEYRRKSSSWIAEVVRNEESVQVIDPIDVFCDQVTCRPYDGNSVFYRDTGHISKSGAARIFESFRADFNWLFGKTS